MFYIWIWEKVLRQFIVAINIVKRHGDAENQNWETAAKEGVLEETAQALLGLIHNAKVPEGIPKVKVDDRRPREETQIRKMEANAWKLKIFKVYCNFRKVADEGEQALLMTSHPSVQSVQNAVCAKWGNLRHPARGWLVSLIS